MTFFIIQRQQITSFLVSKKLVPTNFFLSYVKLLFNIFGLKKIFISPNRIIAKYRTSDYVVWYNIVPSYCILLYYMVSLCTVFCRYFIFILKQSIYRTIWCHIIPSYFETFCFNFLGLFKFCFRLLRLSLISIFVVRSLSNPVLSLIILIKTDSPE